jgi:hypothetical protein
MLGLKLKKVAGNHGHRIRAGLLSDVYSKSKPTGQYEKVASAGGQIYVVIEHLSSTLSSIYPAFRNFEAF